MEINADFSLRIVINHHDLPWCASPELGVEKRMLERQDDDESIGERPSSRRGYRYEKDTFDGTRQRINFA